MESRYVIAIQFVLLKQWYSSRTLDSQITDGHSGDGNENKEQPLSVIARQAYDRYGILDPIKLDLMIRGIFISREEAATLPHRITTDHSPDTRILDLPRLRPSKSHSTSTALANPTASTDPTTLTYITRPLELPLFAPSPSDIISTVSSIHEKWTEKDILLLLELRGRNLGFRLIADYFPGRNQKAVQEKFYKCIKDPRFYKRYVAWEFLHKGTEADRARIEDWVKTAAREKSIMAAAQVDPPPEIATEDDDTPVVVVTVLMTLIATIFIALRLYGCVFILRRRLYLEEWLSVINQIDLWLTAAFVINLYTTTAVGRHWATLSASERTRAVFWHNVLTAPSVLGLGLPKLTVVSLLTRVFKPGELHQTILWVSAILCVVNFVVVILLAWLPCRPISAAWDVSITAKKCLDSWVYVKFCYYATTFSAALDLYFALYPAFVFRKLGWDIRKKLVLSAVMGL
ncbi:hypothetical protein diail_8880, partial [Diaporthe ilicicola]